jgi:MFS family permease
MGTLRAFSGPASQALLPTLVPVEVFPKALATGSMTWQIAMIVGPSVAGAVIGLGGGAGGALALASLLQLSAGMVAMRLPKAEAPSHGASSWTDLLAGLRFVRETRLLLACISLDLFAVLLGGATALMPIFARDVLHVGPEGFGVLRAAPAVGATIMALVLGRYALRRHAGWTMLVAVAIFGIGTIVFGLSRSFPLSVAALVVLGAADMVSVVVRHMVVQLGTPDALRGRVSAVNLVFIGASNELGEFESGVAARLLGPVAAVVLGGIGTLVVVSTWAWWFPELRKADRLISATADPRPGDPPVAA